MSPRLPSNFLTFGLKIPTSGSFTSWCYGTLRSHYLVPSLTTSFRNSPEYHNFRQWTDNKLLILILQPLWGFEGQVAHTFTLVEGKQSHSSQCLGWSSSYGTNGCDVPGSLFLGLFLERLQVEMRDHLDAREIKTPSEMALHADMFWDARRAQRADSIPAAAATSPAHAQDLRMHPWMWRHFSCSPQPNSRSCWSGRMLFLQTFWFLSQ